MKKTILFAAAGILMAAASCSTPKQTAGKVSDLNGEWTIADINGVALNAPADQSPFIGFNSKTGAITGNTGCNSLIGSFNTQNPDGVIDFSQLGSTRMMCPDMSTETAIMNALSEVKGYGIDKDGNILLNNAAGKTVITLTKRADELGLKALDGTMKIVEISDSVITQNPDEPLTVVFQNSDSSFVATTGCNNIAGKYDAAYTSVKFDNMMNTRMMCPDMFVEQSLIQILPNITTFGKLASGNYGFYDNQNNLVLILEPVTE